MQGPVAVASALRCQQPSLLPMILKRGVKSMTAHSSPDSNSELRTDIEAAKQKMRTKVGSGREIKKLTSYLWDNETVNLMAGGTYGAGTGWSC
jgi:hypothetical protein